MPRIRTLLTTPRTNRISPARPPGWMSFGRLPVLLGTAVLGFFAALGLFWGSAALAQAGQPPVRAGGPCDYASFPGVAEFVSVTPAPPDEMMETPYQGTTAVFRFIPDKPIKEQGIYVEGRTYPLTMANGALPGKDYLEKYGVRPGTRVPCEFLVIRQGTCTPTLFRFPGIDRGDYFEWRK